MLFLLMLACSEGPEASAAPEAGPPPALVEVATVSDGALTETWTTIGDVIALKEAELAAAAAGPLTGVYVRIGDRVTKGQVLLEVDRALAAAQSRRAAADARAAKAEARAAETQLERYRQVDDGVLAPVEVDNFQAQAAAAIARAEALDAAAQESAELLRRHRLQAPFDGVITDRIVGPGDWVSAGQRAFAMLSDDLLEVRVEVEGETARRLTPGDTVQLGATSGTIITIVPALRTDSRTRLVRIKPHENAGLLPGQAIDVAFPLRWEGEGVLIPRDALVRSRGGDQVMRVIDGQAIAKPITVIATSNETLLISAAEVAAGDTVVVRGNERLRPGQAVTVKGGETH